MLPSQAMHSTNLRNQNSSLVNVREPSVTKDHSEDRLFKTPGLRTT